MNRPDGVTALGLPITRRGHVSIETSTMEITGGSGFASSSAVFGTSVSLEATAHLWRGLFASARYTSAGFSTPGNLMAGADDTLTLAPMTWLTVGGALGIPLRQDSGKNLIGLYGLTGAMWNFHEFMDSTVPLRIDAGFEMIRGDLGIRVDLQPVVLFPFDQGDADVELLFQHAVEIQYGHALGAGIRLQGVANTFSTDAYQAAVEPFVVVRRDLGFARLGLLKTLDEDTSFYRDAWGIRFSAGFHID